MAFQKSLELPTGVAANYFRIASFRWDRATKEASVLFALYKDAATAAAGQPVGAHCGQAAPFRRPV